MTRLLQVYECEVCGNTVEVLYAGRGELVCCGQPMNLLEAMAGGAGEEKHVPVVEQYEDRITVCVGSTQHPMDDDHYIAWAEVIVDGEVQRKHFKPGDEPKAIFKAKGKEMVVKSYCNVHGLWKQEKE